MKILSGEKGFLGLTVSAMSRKELQPQVFIIPFAFELGEEFGCSYAPQAIITASKEINLFDERIGSYPFHHLNFITVKENSPTRNQRQAIFQMQQWQQQLIAEQQFALLLGGDYRLIPHALLPWLQQDETIAFIHMGAHGYILEELWQAFPQHTYIGLGIRNLNHSLFALSSSRSQHMNIYYARNKNHWDWAAIAKLLNNKRIYLSISVDCLDSSLMSATPWPEAGGLFWDEFFNCIEKIVQITKINGACLCDFSPNEQQPFYDLLIAKLIYRMLATIFLMPSTSTSY